MKSIDSMVSINTLNEKSMSPLTSMIQTVSQDNVPANANPYQAMAVTSINDEAMSMTDKLDTFHCFGQLPKELRFEILRMCLVRDGPVVNPFKPNVFSSDNRSTRLIQDLNLKILRTCRELNGEGIAIFYQENVFHFTMVRYINQGSSTTILRRSRVVPYNLISDFLKSRIHSFVLGNPAELVTTAALVRKIALSSSEKQLHSLDPSSSCHLSPEVCNLITFGREGLESGPWQKLFSVTRFDGDLVRIQSTVDKLQLLIICLDIREPAFRAKLQAELAEAEQRSIKLKKSSAQKGRNGTDVDTLIIHKTSLSHKVQPDDLNTSLLHHLLALYNINFKHIKYED